MSNSYSFLDVSANIVGPGGSFNMGAGASVSKEGITIESVNDIGTMLTGADSGGMHSLSGDRSCIVTVRLLKTAPVNKQLQALLTIQGASAALYGKNAITVRSTVQGDMHVIEGVGFKKQPTITYAEEGGMNEWTFNGLIWIPVLGIGTPEI
jgi:hypothetical protein